VAGVAALYLSQFGNQSAATVASALVGNATTGVVGNPGTGSPNRLLFSLFGGGGGSTTVFSDGFETATGWTTNPSGTDTATTGAWQRGVTFEQPEDGGKEPHWRAVYDNRNRVVVAICHNMDLGDAWEHADDPWYPENMTGLAYRIAINYITYDLSH